MTYRGGGAPVTIDGIEADVQIAAVASASGAAGQRITGAIAGAGFRGRADATVTDAVIDIADLQLKTEDRTGGVPELIGQMLGADQAAAELSLNARGRIPLQQPAEATATGQVQISQGSLAWGGATLTLGQVTINARWPGALDVSMQQVALRDGAAELLVIPEGAVALAGWPGAGSPVHIRRAEFKGPRVRWSMGDGQPAGGWGAVGRNGAAPAPSGAARKGPGSAAGPASSTATARSAGAAATGSPPAASLPLPAVDELVVSNATLIIARPTVQPLQVTGLNINLKAAADASSDQRVISGEITAPPSRLELQARYVPQAQALEQVTLDLRADLTPQDNTGLLAAVRDALGGRELIGQLTAAFKGRLPLGDLTGVSGELRVGLSDARVAWDEYVWPCERLDVSAVSSAGRADVKYAARMLKGDIRGQATVTLAAPRRLEADWQIGGVRIENALRVVQGGQPRHAGRLASNGRLSVDLDSTQSLRGHGEIRLDQGRLLNLPVIRELVAVAGVVQFGVHLGLEDRAESTIDLTGTHVQLSNASVTTPLLGIRGGGRIGYDGVLDLDVTVSVLNKLQGQLGVVGKVLEAVEQGAVSYNIGGTLSNPKVGIRPLGLGK